MDRRNFFKIVAGVVGGIFAVFAKSTKSATRPTEEELTEPLWFAATEPTTTFWYYNGEEKTTLCTEPDCDFLHRTVMKHYDLAHMTNKEKRELELF